MSYYARYDSTIKFQENAMSWLNLALFKLSAYCRCRVINGPDDKPYLERYHLMRLPFGYRVYLHRFVASDPGRGLHNHPWNHALSLVLWGSYEETRMSPANDDNRLVKRQLKAGRSNFIDGSIFHRINLEPDRECWSLFIHGPKAKDWGFMQQKNYRDHNLLVNQPSNPLWWKQASRPIHAPDMRLPCAH